MALRKPILLACGVMVTQLTLTQSFLVRAQAGVPSLRILTANLIQLSIGEKEMYPV